MTPKFLERLRDSLYRRSRSRRVRTMEQAARFVDEVGFCLLFASTQGIELPSLFEAVKGRRDVHIEDWDDDSERVWIWKNDLPASKRAYYGKALAGGKPVFVSLQMLPYLYALSALDDLQKEYAQGRVSLEAKRVYDVLCSRGPTPTMALRAAAGFDRADGSQRFHRALEQLQRAMVILPVGAVVEQGAWASQIFELVARWFPRQVNRAQKIDVDSAQRVLVRRYVETVVAAKVPMIARVFGLPREQVVRTVEELVARKVLSKKNDWVMVNGR